ncbi:cytochrome c [Thalassomonas viridans]|uniref:Cytochrome c n=1 Tax=Thalassomonas viridans TaxID=137584 RepID=A0AAE9Z9H1_9GAMM|nr:cytochrome c [Thalassomonas viridans]WDE08722.1 cytochrome c [Thalassomonas viridans]
MIRNVLTGIAIAILSGFSPAESYAEQPATEQRQQLFKQIEADTERLEDIVDAQSWEQVTTLARQLERDVELLRTLFPDSSRGEGRSKSKIWQNWGDFDQRLSAWSASFEKLAITSQSKDHRQIEAALDSATSTCRSCHMKYRSLW